MTKIIITPAQLKMINEAVATYDGTVPGLNKAVADFRAAGNNTGGSVSFVNENPPLDAPNNAFTGDINVASGSNTVTMTSNDINKLEEVRFSKRQVELGRMLEMRRTGKVFSKKQLNEMFMETQENADELRNIFKNGGGRNLAFKVAEIIDDVFPEESYGSELLDAVLGGADPAEFIIQNIFSDFADKEQEREVLDRIRELTTKRGF